jgi:hypothetical protein
MEILALAVVLTAVYGLGWLSGAYARGRRDLKYLRRARRLAESARVAQERGTAGGRCSANRDRAAEGQLKDQDARARLSSL